MTEAYIPSIEPVVSELRLLFAQQLLSLQGSSYDAVEVADDAAFLADFVLGKLDDDDDTIIFTPDDDDDGSDGGFQLKLV